MQVRYQAGDMTRPTTKQIFVGLYEDFETLKDTVTRYVEPLEAEVAKGKRKSSKKRTGRP